MFHIAIFYIRSANFWRRETPDRPYTGVPLFSSRSRSLVCNGDRSRGCPEMAEEVAPYGVRYAPKTEVISRGWDSAKSPGRRGKLHLWARYSRDHGATTASRRIYRCGGCRRERGDTGVEMRLSTTPSGC